MVKVPELKQMGLLHKMVSILLAVVLMCGTCIPISGCSQGSSGDSAASSESGEQETPSVAYTEGVAKGAGVVHLVVQADAPLAQEVAPESIIFDGALYGFEPSDITRIDDTSLGMTATLPEGARMADDSYAYVLLDAAAYAEPHELLFSDEGESAASDGAGGGEAADSADEQDAAADDDPAAVDLENFELAQIIGLPVADATATVLPLDGAYDSAANVFLLPVSLGYGEFARTPEAADFTLSDAALKIVGVDYDEASRSCATLRIDAPADALRSTFEALDAALTANGVKVAGGATNCGDVSAASGDEAENGTSVLSCLAPNAHAVFDETYAIESKTQDADGSTDYDVQVKATIDAAPGSCSLPEEGIGEAVHVDAIDGEVQDLGEDVIRVDSTSLFLNIYLPSKAVTALTADEGDEATDDAAKVVAQLARVHKLVLDEGVLSNAWGVPEPQTEVRLYGSDEEAEADEANFQLIQKAYADTSSEEDIKKAKEAFEMMEKILETAGAFAELAEGNISGAITGTAGLFGIVAMGLGYGEGELLSLEDVMDKLNNMDNTLKQVDAKIDKLADKLAKMEKELNYYKDLDSLRDCLSHSQMYGKSYTTYLSNTGSWKYDPSKGIAGLTKDQRATLEKFVASVGVFEDKLGTTAYKDTIRLGGLITGDAGLQADNIVEEYYAVVDGLFNWEPETYIYRQAFMARLGQAYTLCYSTATTELQLEAANSSTPEKYQDAMAALTESYQAVQKVLQGDVVYPEADAEGGEIEITPSVYVDAALGRNDGFIKNNVTNQLFSTGSLVDIYGDHMQAGQTLADFCGRDVNPIKVKTYAYNQQISISEGHLQTMLGNVGNAGYDNLWKELVGVTGSSRPLLNEFDARGIHWAESWADGRAKAETDVIGLKDDWSPFLSRIVISNAERNCLHKQPSRRYTYSWTGDYFDLSDSKNPVHKGEVLYLADEVYKAGKGHWYMNVQCHSFFTLQASDSK